MRIHLTLLAAIMLAGGVVPASSQTKFFWGEGNAACSEWTAERSAKTVLGTQLAAWVRGYVSGANVMQNLKGNIFGLKTAEMDSAEKWIGDYCLAHPSDRLVVAADLLVKALIAQ